MHFPRPYLVARASHPGLFSLFSLLRLFSLSRLAKQTK